MECLYKVIMCVSQQAKETTLYRYLSTLSWIPLLRVGLRVCLYYCQLSHCSSQQSKWLPGPSYIAYTYLSLLSPILPGFPMDQTLLLNIVTAQNKWCYSGYCHTGGQLLTQDTKQGRCIIMLRTIGMILCCLQSIKYRHLRQPMHGCSKRSDWSGFDPTTFLPTKHFCLTATHARS